MNQTRQHRRRIGTLSAGALLGLLLTAGCASETPAPPGADPVPTTLAPKPHHPQQPPVVRTLTPQYRLAGLSQASAEQAWEQSVALLPRWTFNPRYMLLHAVTRTELDDLAKVMTPDAGRRWKRQAHRALGGYVRATPDWLAHRRTYEARVNQLVTFRVQPPANRGWDNPMIGPLSLTSGAVLGGPQGVTVSLELKTAYRLTGQGGYYRVPLKTRLNLAWVPTSDGWKLDRWWRVYITQPERTRTPSNAATASEGERPRDRTPSVSPGATLYPE